MGLSKHVAPNELTATEAIRAIDKGELRGRDVVQACLARIAERESRVRAWTHLDGAQVLRLLDHDDEQRGRAPLRGLPVGIKDVIDTVTMPTAYGSPIYKDSKAPWDAACVALLRSAGATILGKTATTEFAMREPALTRNPLNLDHSPGGSSSGSAAAVADFMVPLALGSQTTGSTIRPASFCGVYALKPSFGMINRSGLYPLSDSFDTVGIFSRSIEDLYLGMTIASGAGRAAPWQRRAQTQAPRIAFCRTPHWSWVEESVQAKIEEVSVRLGTLGAKVTSFDLPDGFDGLDESQGTVANFEMFRALSYERLTHYEMLSDTLKERLGIAETITHEQYMAAQAHFTHCRSLIQKLMEDYDCILTPSAAGESPRMGSTGNPMFQKIWHGLGLPAVNIPALRGENDLPVGLQIVGRPWADEMTLHHCEWIRCALDL